MLIRDLDSIANDPQWLPRHGWHDDHRAADGTDAYLPALQQVRSEFVEFADLLCGRLDARASCLQLGLGACDASHAVWSALFDRAVTIDLSKCLDGADAFPGTDTHDAAAREWAEERATYDLLFIDAGHAYLDVHRDFVDYHGLVRPGGIVAFHDALERASHPEVRVWRFLETLRAVSFVGDEVGIGWIRV